MGVQGPPELMLGRTFPFLRPYLRATRDFFVHQVPDFFIQWVPVGYKGRLRNEIQNFSEITCVHDLPEIFHYWSNRYLRPKLEQFGFRDPDHFFLKNIEDYLARGSQAAVNIACLGSGNCDLEIALAEQLRTLGYENFIFDCIDVNPHMLKRGRQLAHKQGLENHFQWFEVDFNQWKPASQYDILLANQCLHHVSELEHLFGAIQRGMGPDSLFLVSDMIGRNGHQRWPEALTAMAPFWDELPIKYKHNHQTGKLEKRFVNRDYSRRSFEGIRAQDILPLLVQDFEFDLFIPFANIVTPFIDRGFGPNFDSEGVWDRDFIDRLHACDEQGLLSGNLKPTQMFAVLKTVATRTRLLQDRLTPEFCIRPTS